MRTEREKVRDILNNSRDINFSHATETVKNLIQSKAEAPFIINHIVTKAKLVKGTISTVQLFQIFYHYTKEIVDGNRFCRTEYQKQMFLKNIWITSNLQTMVMDQIRKGYKMILEPEEYKEKTKRPMVVIVGCGYLRKDSLLRKKLRNYKIIAPVDENGEVLFEPSEKEIKWREF
jgi:hypothetical protein